MTGVADLVISGGRVVCAATGIDRVADVHVAGAHVLGLHPPGTPIPAGARHLDARERVVLPGLVDLAVHLRAPGREDDETLDVTLAAALAGGVTTLVALSDTQPPVDGADDVQQRLAAARDALPYGPDVVVAGCLTRRREGKEIADHADMTGAGARVLTDVAAVADTEVLRRALEYAKSSGARVVMLDPTDAALGKGTVATESPLSTRMGLRAVPLAAQAIGAARDRALSALTGMAVHHHAVTTPAAVSPAGLSPGGAPTSSTTMWHLLFDEESLRQRPYDTALRLWPPLAPAAERKALLDLVRRGLVAVSSGHRPVPNRTKDLEFSLAEPGATGLALALPLLWGALTPIEIAKAMSALPASILGLTDRGRIEPGARADLVVVDPRATDLVDEALAISRSWANPARGARTAARVVATVAAGRVAFQRSDA
ncbi:MAG: amidohydrolase family protein [Deltaproteobacteria bacterium]|nr:amidohydrolase family protein [Deltaproteobacteria bacterium]